MQVANLLGYGLVRQVTRRRVVHNPHFQLTIGRHSQQADFVSKMKERVFLKREQLFIFEEAFQFVPKGYTWYNLIGREAMLQLIDLCAKMRQLNRRLINHGSSINLDDVRQDVLSVSEERIQQRERNRRRMHLKATTRHFENENIPPETLREMYLHSGLKVTEVANYFGITERMLRTRLKRHNIPPRCQDISQGIREWQSKQTARDSTPHPASSQFAY